MKNKKGQVFDNLAGLAVGIATFAIIIVVAFLIIANVKEQDAEISGLGCNSTAGDLACNATITMQSAVQGIPGWVPLIVIVAIGATILGMIGMFQRR